MIGVSDTGWSKYAVEAESSGRLITADEFKKMKEAEQAASPKVQDSTGNVFKSLEEERREQFTKAREENNFWDVLTSDVQRFKADLNNNDIIEYEEYKAFILSQHEEAVEIPYQNRHESINTMKHHYSIDYSVLIAIGMVCLTVVIISLLKRR